MLGQFGGKMTENGEIRSQFCRVWNHETLEPIWGLAVAASGMVKKKFEMTFNARAYGLINRVTCSTFPGACRPLWSACNERSRDRRGDVMRRRAGTIAAVASFASPAGVRAQRAAPQGRHATLVDAWARDGAAAAVFVGTAPDRPVPDLSGR